jgi:hypothetical protein
VLTVLATDEFETWFRALPDRDAEEVAAGVELIEKLGPERSPPASSDLLLWYQSPSGSPRLDRYYNANMVEFAQRARHIVQHLSGASTRQRLAEVSLNRALRVRSALASIRAQTRGWRGGITDEEGESRLDAMQREYMAALEALELEEARPATPGKSLRELIVRGCEPALRVLYGVDAEGSRALLILGESLDRRAFGPSVRRALSIWQRFSSSSAEARVLATGSDR